MIRQTEKPVDGLDRTAEVVRLRKTGMTQKAIAAQLGVSTARISQILIRKQHFEAIGARVDLTEELTKMTDNELYTALLASIDRTDQIKAERWRRYTTTEVLPPARVAVFEAPSVKPDPPTIDQ